MEQVTIEQIKVYTPKIVEELNKLLFQLDSNIPKRKEEFVKLFLESPHTRVFVARNRDGVIIGITTLIIFQALSGKRATLEDLVVDKEYRGQGIGKNLLKTALEAASKENIVHVDWTSKPSRVEANKMYQSMGFEKRDTNVYRYRINNSKGKS